MNAAPRMPHRAGDAGFSMIVVLVVLVVVSMLGIAATKMVMQTERSSRYDRDWQIAWQAAEAALLDAEFDIRGPNTNAGNRVSSFSPTSMLGFAEGCGSGSADRGLCMPAAAGAKPVWYQVDFTDDTASAKTVKFGDFTGRPYATGSTGVRPVKPPRYIIEVIPDQAPGTSTATPKVLYRVTAMGFGPRIETQAVLQMVFRKE
jgi:type IV pilus assembly protein PilX